MTRKPIFSILLPWFLASGVAEAQVRQIDAANSTVKVHVSRAGVLSAFGHDHEIAAPIASGTVDAGAQRVELHINATAMKVTDPGASDKDRAEIQSTMLGPEVLDSNQYREIIFRSTSAERQSEEKWRVTGNLTLHGQNRPVVVEATGQGGHYAGTARIRQKEFGIKPVKIAGGTVRVKDELQIDLDIRLLP
jgi:polyisoprenoid-binding protein YceI